MWVTLLSFKGLRDKLHAEGTPHKEVHFQACMHGGDRNKHTSLWYGGAWYLTPLALMCAVLHSRKPWSLSKEQGTIFAASDERRYPSVFCARVASIAAAAFGVTPGVSPVFGGDAVHAGKQPRRGTSELIPEFQHYLPAAPTTERERVRLAELASRKSMLDNV